MPSPDPSPTAEPTPTPDPGPTPTASPTPVPSPTPDVLAIADVRERADGASATIEGTLTTALGALEGGRGGFVQDGSGGIALYLDAPAGAAWPAGTHVRATSYGYGTDEESLAMRRFFEAGNQQTIETLRRHFSAPAH